MAGPPPFLCSIPTPQHKGLDQKTGLGPIFIHKLHFPNHRRSYHSTRQLLHLHLQRHLHPKNSSSSSLWLPPAFPVHPLCLQHLVPQQTPPQEGHLWKPAHALVRRAQLALSEKPHQKHPVSVLQRVRSTQVVLSRKEPWVKVEGTEGT